MSKLNVDEFVSLVQRSGLVDDERLSQALSGVDQSVKDSGIVASILTKADLLTEWQSEKLLEGRHKGFYLGKFKLLKLLGAGGMGAVYLAEHRTMRHRVAIKCLPKTFAKQTSYLERFIQEARASAQLNHPNMVRAHDVDNDGDNWYIVMDFILGDDLQKIVSRQGALDFRTAADYTRQAALGLAYAHRCNMVHRDIKPANLLVENTGTVKLLDMGLALVPDTAGSLLEEDEQKMIGTVDYMAPEQALDSHSADARSDIYSLGCTLYFMLQGDAPFPKGTVRQRLMQHQSAEPVDVRNARPDAPPTLLAICNKMMAKNPRDRFQTADEVSAALEDWLKGETYTPLTRSSYVPPDNSGPSLNENLTFADVSAEAAEPGPSPSKVGSKSGGAGSHKGSAGAKTGRPGAGKNGAPKMKEPAAEPIDVGPLPEIKVPSSLSDDLLSADLLPTADTLPLANVRRKMEEERAARQGIPVWLMIVGGVLVGGIIAGILALLLI